MNTPHTCTILLAEDDSDDRILFREALSAVGDYVSLIEVDNGQTILDILRIAVTLPDFIVLDVNMPRISGIDCLKKIREDLRLTDIPVIIMSTSASGATVAQAKDAGATKYAVKPARFDELIAIVRYICNEDLNSQQSDFILNNAVTRYQPR